MTMFQNLARTMEPGDMLKIECVRCGRRTAWSKAEASLRLGDHAAPYDIRRRLRCSGCGARGGGRVKVWI
jgi:hypothetical protein